MARQYYADITGEAANAAFGTLTNTTETALIPTVHTPIPAFEPRAGKVYELIIGGTISTNASASTMIITPRVGTTISGTSLGVSPTQNLVANITNAPFLYSCYLIFRSIGVSGAAGGGAICSGLFEAGGAIATAASQSSVQHCTTGAAVAVDTSITNALWIGVTFSLAPVALIPLWHAWRAAN